jgi:hypothetical protein
MRNFNIFAIASLAYAANCRVLQSTSEGEVIIAPAELGSPNHDDASCLKETTYRGLPEQPFCPSGYDQVALSCLKHCDSGYVNFGATCGQSCPSGFRDDGAFCAKTETKWTGPWYARRLEFTQDCPNGMQDWGITCKKDEYARQTTSPSCSSS